MTALTWGGAATDILQVEASDAVSPTVHRATSTMERHAAHSDHEVWVEKDWLMV